MAYETLEQLPETVKSQLPRGAQQIFLAAFNSASSDGLSEDAASQLAWNSVKTQYEQSSQGEWTTIHKGGANMSSTGTMPAS
ncbi:ChaB family protein [Capilliphycus salinus ALCB114379]|uniref:ChaB family protein n=1 Tax=Capilliphycus salinus TaxID=2768948 RepID=UPI0039A4BCF2